MKNTTIAALIVIFLVPAIHAETTRIDITPEQVHAAFDRPVPPHPRLLLNDAQMPALRQRIESDPMMKGFYEGLLEKAQNELDSKPLERKLTGRRLLGVSRDCLRRVLLWSTAYRLNGDQRFLHRTEQEMLAAASFSDWNPNHFLDVAEMTAALAIGYDWLYNDLPQTSRDTIRTAILEKGLQPSLVNTGPFRNSGNWNQVCNGGITLGTLAILEDEPELAETIVHRAVNGVQVVMNKYEPDGAYPEGPGYWDYGTTYNVLLLAALESVIGTDFGLADLHGFSKCADYFLHVCGPTGLYFNYPDSGTKKSFSPAVFWFAQKYTAPEVAWNDYKLWKKALETTSQRLYDDRMAPLTLLWAKDEPAAPKQTRWMGRGENPVAMFRTAWTDPDAVYLAVKGGSPRVNHGHMDIGSFVLDADGLRWAVDLGPENYNKIESLGMNLWGMNPDSDRWTIFRYNNFSHNTLVVNGQHQIIKASAPIVRYSDKPEFSHAVIDMSPVYNGQLEKALRGAALLPTGQILIQDELKAPAGTPAKVRWAMATPAAVAIQSNRQAVLTQKGKTMRFEVLGPDHVELTTYSANPKADYDQPNPGIVMIGFEVELQPGQDIRLAVLMSPQSSEKSNNIPEKPVLTWSEPIDQ